MSLTLMAQPGFTELPDATFNTGAALSSASMKALNADAKFGAVRNEQFWGFYRNGETVVLPVSPADGYVYSLSELVFSWSWYWTGSAPTALNGTQSAPVGGATSGQGTVLQMSANVNQATGLVTTGVSYFKAAEADTNDGILMVLTHAQRSR